MPLDAVCLQAVLAELRPQLLNLRIDKVQQPAKDQVILLLRGNKRLLLNAGASAPRIQLTELLREKDVLDIKTVQFAILETDGNLSVFPYPAEQPASARATGIQAGKQYLPVTIIEDGFFSEENLQRAGKDRRWLDRVLEERRTTVSDPFLLTVDRAGHICWLRKEGKP